MTGPHISRRAVVGGAAGLAVFGVPKNMPSAGAVRQTAPNPDLDVVQPRIRPRADWAGTLGLAGQLVPEDVRFLLVHHTLVPGNNYDPDEVPRLLQGIYQFHTQQKGWPDVAYNFMVDQFGTIWETRAGSLDGPVRGDATGGNQGFSQLCCFLGDLSAQPPSETATQSMANLLTWLAASYNVDTTPGQTVTFESLGSNKFPRGSTVTVNTISGHRDVSQTACPGDAGYEIVQTTLPEMVTAQLVAFTTPPTTAPMTPTTVDQTTTQPTSPTTQTSTAEFVPTTLGGDPTATSSPTDELAVQESGGQDGGVPVGFFGLGAAAVAVGGAGLAYGLKRSAGRADRATEPEVPLAVPIPPGADAWSPVPAGSAPPQRVWWATGPDAPPEVRQRVGTLARQVDSFASNPMNDTEADRAEWARMERHLSEAARTHQAALVAARPGMVYLLRNGPSTAVVTSESGHVRRDSSAEALAVDRDEVATFEVFFSDSNDAPDIQVHSPTKVSG